MSDGNNVNYILGNFRQFFDKLSQTFEAKDSYEIYRDKAKSADNSEEAINFMIKSVKEARNMFSKSLFEEFSGNLWRVEDARPYLIMRKELAELYVYNQLFDEGIIEYFDILDLDKEDNLKVQYDLAMLLLNQGRYDDFEKLLNEYIEKESTCMFYSKALYNFLKKDNVNAKRFIKKAFKSNLYVPIYLLGIKNDSIYYMEREILDDEVEAILYSSYGGEAWIKTKESLYWLIDELFIYANKNNFDLAYTKKELKLKIEDIC